MRIKKIFSLIKKVFTILCFFIFFSLLMINLFLLIFWYSGRLQNYIVKKALPIISNELGVEITLNKLSGNLFNKFTFIDLKLFDVKDDYQKLLVGSIDSLTVSWDVFDIFKGKINVHSITINNVYGYVMMTEEGINFDSMFSSKIEYTEEEKIKRQEKSLKIEEKKKIKELNSKGKQKKTFKITHIIADEVILHNIIADFYTDPKNFFIGEYITIETIITTFSMINKEMKADVTIENLVTKNPDIVLDHLEVKAELANKVIRLNKMNLFTENSILETKGFLNLKDFSLGEVDLTFNPLSPKDFNFLLQNINYDNDMIFSFDFSADLSENTATINIQLKENDLEISTTNVLHNYLDIFEKSILALENNFTSSIAINNFDVFKYLDMVLESNNKSNKLKFNTNIYINAKNFDIKKMEALIDIEIMDLNYNDLLIDSVLLNTSVQKRDINLELAISTDAGDIFGELNLNDYLTQQKYTITVDIESFDFYKVLPSEIQKKILNVISPPQDAISEVKNAIVNGKIDINGQFFHLDSLYVVSSIDLGGSTILTNNIDSLFINFEISDNTYNLNELVLMTPNINFFGNAKATEIELLESNISLFVEQPESIIDLFINEKIDFDAFLYLNASGKWDAMQVALFSQLNNIKYNDFSIDRIVFDHDVYDLGKYYSDNIISFYNASINDINVEHISIVANTINKDIVLAFDIDCKDIVDLSLNSTIYWSDNIEVLFKYLKIRNGYIDWENKEYFDLSIAGKNILLENFNLFSLDQSIVSERIEKINNDIMINLVIQNLIIKEILNNFEPEININGVFDLVADIIVSDKNVYAEVEALIKNLSLLFDNFEIPLLIDYLKIDSRYDDNTLDIKNEIKYKDNLLNTTAILPLHVEVKDNLMYISPDDSLNVKIEAKNFNFDIINFFLPPKNNLQSTLDLDLEVTGTAVSPALNGYIITEAGTFKNSLYGINFANIATNVEFIHTENINTVSINDLSFNTGRGKNKGTFGLKGFSTIILNNTGNNDTSLIEIGETKLDLKMNNVQFTNHKALKTNISGNLSLNDIPSRLSDSKTKFINFPKFRLQGEVTTNEVKVNLDELTKINTIEIVPEPLLVIAQKSDDSLSNIVEEVIPFKMPEFEVNFQVDMPRNVWLQSKEMNLELRGAVDYKITQNNEFIIGNVEVVRGYIEYFTRRFTIEEGIVIITGTDLPDVVVNLKANYVFRDTNRSSSVLTLLVEGNMQTPSITFYQDGLIIEEEADAIALLLFGKRMNEMRNSDDNRIAGDDNGTNTDNGANQDSSRDASAVTVLGAGLLSAEVSNALQKQLGVDVVSIKFDSELLATVTIGNYIGRRLFVSYEREIDYAEFNAVQADRINVEYQITKNVFLVTTQGLENENGIDLIFRWQKNEKNSKRY